MRSVGSCPSRKADNKYGEAEDDLRIDDRSAKPISEVSHDNQYTES